MCIVWLLDSGVSQHQVCMNKVGFRKLRAGGEEEKLMEFIKSQITIHYMDLISGIFSHFPRSLARAHHVESFMQIFFSPVAVCTYILLQK